MIGFDTSALVDLFKNDKALISLLAIIEEPIFLNKISYLELLFGLNPEDKNHEEEEGFYDNLFSSFPNLGLDFKSCKKARDIFWDLRKRGKSIEPFDCTIAGIYLNNGVNKIITKNVKHFSKIPKLKIIPY